MKIAYIVGSFPILSETFILNQITGLLSLGHRIDIFAGSNPYEEKVHSDVKAYQLMERVHYFDMPADKIKRVLKSLDMLVKNFQKAPVGLLQALNAFKYGKDARSLQLLYAYVAFLGREQDYDIIHCHFGPNGKKGILLRELGIKGKVITSFYGNDISSHVEQFGPNVYDSLFQQGDLFIAISEHIRRRLIDIGCDEDKIVRHCLGIDVERFHFRGSRRQAGEKPRILTVARLVEKKGLDYSIKAVAKVVKKRPNVEYNIAGDGPLRSQLESLISRLDVKEQVKLLGWQDRDEIRRLYQESHIFVLASVTARNGDQEGQGLVLQEAQAMGLPVISTLHNGLPEGVLDGQSGFLVPERDVDALAERLEYLIEHPELWAEMGRAGRRFVEQHYDIKKLNQRLVDIYETVLSEG